MVRMLYSGRDGSISASAARTGPKMVFELQVQVVDSLSDALLGFRFRRIQGLGPIHGDITAEVALEEGKLRL